MHSDHPITVLLSSAATGDVEARRQLWTLVHAELHQMAVAQMAREAPGRTLQPTALVNEAYLRLVGGAVQSFENRRHFFAAAGRAMHQILVDDARRRGRGKRGGSIGRHRVDADLLSADTPNVDSADLMAVDQALASLEDERPDLAEVVRLRFFVGLSLEETADVLGVARRTVINHWRIARAMLYGQMSGDE